MGIAAVFALIAAHNSRKTRASTESIEKQMSPNGGKSLRDAIDRLEQGHLDLASGQIEIRAEIVKLTHRTNTLESEQAELADAVTAPPKRTPRKKAS